MKQKPLLMRSPLTGSVYVVTRYVASEGGLVEALEKHDVTDQFEQLAAEVWADGVTAAVDGHPEPTNGSGGSNGTS